MSEEKTSIKEEVGSLESVIDIMNRVNEVFSYEVWVPSLNKNVMFREINTNQQKRLIKSIIDSPVYNTEFIFTLRKIIQENCVDTSIDIDQLTIIDKLVIAMKMRSVSVSDTLELQVPIGKVGKDDKQKTIKRGVSIEKLITDIKKNTNIPEVETFTDDKGIYKIECGIPTISTEYKLENEMRNNSESKDIKNYEDLRQTVGDVFTGEIAKYIRGLCIIENDTTTKIDFNTICFKNRIALIEKIPERIVKNVITYIDKVKREIDKITLVQINIGTENEPEIKEEKLSIDGSFFTHS